MTKLDLSKNELTSLPEDFGNLHKLKHLDLYRNQIQHLPLSFSKLKDLKWLDLKDNPLVPAVAKIAGPCLDTKQCQTCARDVVNFFVKLENQVNTELEMRNKTRQKQLEINQQKKQVEKKEKKKEKQKQRREVVVVQQNEVPKSKSKKEPKKIKQDVIKKPKKSCAKTLLNLLFLSFFLLFIFTSVKLSFTKKVELYARDLYKITLDKLPPNIKPYGTQFGSIFQNVHEKTGNMTLRIVKYFDENIPKTTRDQILEHLRSIWQTVWMKLNEIYTNILGTN